MKRSLIALSIASVLALACSARAEGFARTAPWPQGMQEPAPPGNAERAMFTQGQNLFLQGSYSSAAEVLEKFLDTYPNSILTDLTLLWLGRAYFQLGKFSEAEELGKRLRAIKDTPFADIYDTELRAALREAAKQQSASPPETVPAVAEPVISSPVVPIAGRERYAKTRTATPAPANATKKTSNAARRPVAKPSATTKSNQKNAARNPNGQTSRRPVRPASANAKRPSTPRNKTVRPGGSASTTRDFSAGNKPPRRSTQNPRKGMASAKPSSKGQTPRRDSVSRGRAAAPAATIAKRSGRQSSSTKTALNVPNKKRNSLAQNSIGSSNRRNSTASNNRRPPASASGVSRATVAAPVAGGSDSPRPSALNEHVATGGLYSMIDTALASPPANVTPETRVDAKARGMNAKPGETIYLSFVVRNYGSIRQTYELRVTAPGSPEAQLYVDSNGDGLHQNDELKVTGSPVIELKNSEVPFLLEVNVPRNAAEGQQYVYTVTVVSFSSGQVVAKVTSTLTVSSIRASLSPASVPERSVSSLTK